jgi:phosphatidylethanolamine/phosphatidyl-N-methylethanolamine N-methyltransferase
MKTAPMPDAPATPIERARRVFPRLFQSFAPATTRPVAASLHRSNIQYAELATTYDANTPRIERLRHEAHRLLNLRAGDTVLDLGCGTGKSIVALSHAVGESGRVIAIEPCKEMVAVARERVEKLALSNVVLIEGDASELRRWVEPNSANAVLLMFTHDLLQSVRAIDAMLNACQPGARFALSGGKLFSGPLALLNPWVEWRQKQYCTTFENYDAPWRKLFATGAFDNTFVHPKYMGIAYIAYGECATDRVRTQSVEQNAN